jgi:hypothetical protein
VLLLVSCGLCTDEKLAEATSPNGDWLAEVFVRDCGATTDFATSVLLRYKTERSKPDASDRSVLSLYHLRGGVRLHWLSDKKLQIECACSRDMVRKTVRVYDQSVDISIVNTSGQPLLPE